MFISGTQTVQPASFWKEREQMCMCGPLSMCLGYVGHLVSVSGASELGNLELG